MTEDPQPDEQTPLPCYECPATKLEEFLVSASGQGMSAVIDYDFAIQSGIKVTLQEINYREFQLLRLLGEERKRWEVEQIQRERNKMSAK